FASRWRCKACHDVEQRGLAAARGPDHREELSLRELEVERAERVHRRFPGVDPGHAAQRDVTHFLRDFRSSGRKDSSISFDQSASPCIAPTIFCARIMLSMVSMRMSPGPQ